MFLNGKIDFYFLTLEIALNVTNRNWVQSFIKNIDNVVGRAVFDMIKDGQSNTIDGKYRIWLTHGTVVNVNGRTRVDFLQGSVVDYLFSQKKVRYSFCRCFS